MAALRSPAGRISAPRLALVTVAACLSAALAAPAYAQSSVLDELLEKLKDKGVLSEEEYAALKAARDEEQAEQRAERQRQAARAAQEAEKEERAKETANAKMTGKSKDGLVVWQSGDGETAISINGRAQLDYRHFDDNIQPSTFDIRRAYFGAKGKFGKYYEWDVTFDAGGSGSALLDVAYFDAAWIDWAKLRFGQFKMPMSLEELTSSRFIDFQERSFVNSFVYGKERGVMAFGNPFNGLGYGLALSTGEGKNTNETVSIQDGNDTIARVYANAAQWMGWKDTVVHLGGGYGTGLHQNLAAPTLRTEARGVTFFSANEAFSGNVDRTRRDLELALAYGPVKLQGEYNVNSFEGTTFSGAEYSRDINTYYVAAGWLLTGETYASAYKSDGRFDRIRPNHNFSTDFSGLGALELAARYSSFDGGDFTAANPVGSGTLKAGTTNKANAYTLGVKWIPTPNTRFMLNYVQTKFDTPVTVSVGGSPQQFEDEKAIILRAQFDF